MNVTLDVKALCVCPNPQCRVVHFTAGTAGPRCPACYASTTNIVDRVLG